VQLNPNGTLPAAIPFNLSVMDLSFTLVYILNRLDVSEFAYRCILVVVLSVLRKILFFQKQLEFYLDLIRKVFIPFLWHCHLCAILSRLQPYFYFSL